MPKQQSEPLIGKICMWGGKIKKKQKAKFDIDFNPIFLA